MKIALFVLCVVLPSLYICTPLPDGSADAYSEAGASANGQGGGQAAADAQAAASTDGQGGSTAEADAEAAASSTGQGGGQAAAGAQAAAGTNGQGGSTASGSGSGTGTANGGDGSSASGSGSGTGTANGGNGSSASGSGSGTGSATSNGAQGGGSANADSSASASANAQTGKPTIQGFTNYSVLKMCSEQFKSQIDKTTWYVAKYTKSQEQVQSDVTLCADRYICDTCKAVKFQYVVEDGNFVVKEWGYDGQNLIYIQENISFSTQEFIIIKSDVVNVMKATKDSKVATSVSNSQQVKSYLNAEYAILGTDYKNYFVGQTSSEKGSITFVAFTQQIYECKETQKQYSQQISQILNVNGIDESSLSELTQKFEVDTNQFTSVTCETSSDGKTTTTNQQSQHPGGCSNSGTETSASGGNASAGSAASAQGASQSPPCQGTPPPSQSPPCQGTPTPSGPGASAGVGGGY